MERTESNLNSSPSNKKSLWILVKPFTSPPSWLPSIVAIVLGIFVGICVKMLKLRSQDVVVQVMGAPGKIFMNCLKCVIPLYVVLMMMRSMFKIKNLKKANRFISLSFFAFVLMSSLTCFIPVLLMWAIKVEKIDGGVIATRHPLLNQNGNVSMVQSIVKMFYLSIPDGFIGSLVKNNLMGSMVLGSIIGLALSGFANTEKGHRYEQFLNSIFKSIEDVISILIKLTPIGLYSIMVDQMSTMKSLNVFKSIGQLLGVLVLSNVIYTAFYVLLQVAFIKKFYVLSLKKFISPVINGVGIASGVSVLPEIKRIATDKLGYDNLKTELYLSIGNVMMKNGTSIYFCIMTIFAGEMTSNPLGKFRAIVFCFVAALFSAACPPMPMGSIINISAIAGIFNIKIPPELFSVLLAVDPIFGRINTVTFFLL
ncbi:hypothetical protein MHBO_002693 [Bonamia ostreae]|uniref:Amino acid transporter n=1 Tax=Bonamia ostreae TaxID=126728 RepID=A0ABV2ANA2_9EUKA